MRHRPRERPASHFGLGRGASRALRNLQRLIGAWPVHIRRPNAWLERKFVGRVGSTTVILALLSSLWRSPAGPDHGASARRIVFRTGALAQSRTAHWTGRSLGDRKGERSNQLLGIHRVTHVRGERGIRRAEPHHCILRRLLHAVFARTVGCLSHVHSVFRANGGYAAGPVRQCDASNAVRDGSRRSSAGNHRRRGVRDRRASQPIVLGNDCCPRFHGASARKHARMGAGASFEPGRTQCDVQLSRSCGPATSTNPFQAMIIGGQASASMITLVGAFRGLRWLESRAAI